MDIKRRQALGIARSLNISEEIATQLVAAGLTTSQQVLDAPEGQLLEYKVKTKVVEKLSRVRAAHTRVGR